MDSDRIATFTLMSLDVIRMHVEDLEGWMLNMHPSDIKAPLSEVTIGNDTLCLVLQPSSLVCGTPGCLSLRRQNYNTSHSDYDTTFFCNPIPAAAYYKSLWSQMY